MNNIVKDNPNTKNSKINRKREVYVVSMIVMKDSHMSMTGISMNRTNQVTKQITAIDIPASFL
jgi:hypothetical protein